MNRPCISLGSALLLSTPSLPVLAALDTEHLHQTQVESAALVLGGVGLFLVGILFIGPYLQRLAGGSFTRIILQVSDHPLGRMLGGTLLGAFTQSGKATAFILSDFVKGGMMRMNSALTLVFFGNFGACLIVFISMFNIKLFVLCLLGITGLGLTFHKPERLFNVYGVAFGLALVMYGLFLVKSGAAGFTTAHWMQQLVVGSNDYFGLAFILGFTLTMALQSNVATILMLIAVVDSGLFTVDGALMGVFGAQAAHGLLTYIFSFHAQGRARQIVMSQVAYDFIVTVFCLFVFSLEIYGGIPLLIHLVQVTFMETHAQLVALVLITQGFGALALAGATSQLKSAISRYFKPTVVEVLSSTRYINPGQSISTPEATLLLVKREQQRLLERLPLYLEYVRCREQEQHGGLQPPDALHEACEIISNQINETLSSISSRSLSEVNAGQLMSVTKIQEQLTQLDSVVYTFSQQLMSADTQMAAYALGEHILESLDFMVLSVIDAVRSLDEEDIDMASLLMGDRTDMMARLRDDYFGSGEEVNHEERTFIFDITLCMENAAQILSRICTIVKTVVKYQRGQPFSQR